MPEPQEKPRLLAIPPCYQIFDKAWFCVTPMNQVSKFYKNGEMEDCTGILTDWTLCMMCKGYYKPAEKQRIMSKATIFKSSLHVNRTWKLKEKPGWGIEAESTGAPEKNGSFPADFPKDLQQFPDDFDEDD